MNPAAQRVASQDELDRVAIGAALFARTQRVNQAQVQQTIHAGFRNSHMPAEVVKYKVMGHELTLNYRVERDGSFTCDVNKRPYKVIVLSANDRGIDYAVDGQRGELSVTLVDLKQGPKLAPKIGQTVLTHGPSGDIELLELPRYPQAERAEFRGGLMAPMPGKVLSVNVEEGGAVEAGQLLMILEAMKMEHRITAPAKGVVKALKVAQGEQVANGALLVVFEAAK